MSAGQDVGLTRASGRGRGLAPDHACSSLKQADSAVSLVMVAPPGARPATHARSPLLRRRRCGCIDRIASWVRCRPLVRTSPTAGEFGHLRHANPSTCATF